MSVLSLKTAPRRSPTGRIIPDYAELNFQPFPSEKTMNTNNTSYTLNPSINATKQHGAKAKTSILSPTARKYINNAVSKYLEPLHPNFQAKSTEKSLEQLNIARHSLAVAYDKATDKTNGALIVVTAAKTLLNDLPSYVRMFKDLAANIAFDANLDCGRIRKQLNNVDRTATYNDLDAMGEDDAAITGETSDTVNDALTHKLSLSDIPVADADVIDTDTDTTTRVREPYEGGDAPAITAESITDATDAVERVQLWCAMAFKNFDADKSKFWGVDGDFPLGQKVLDDANFGKIYVPIRNFEEYVEYQAESFKARNRVVPQAQGAALDEMAAAS